LAFVPFLAAGFFGFSFVGDFLALFFFGFSSVGASPVPVVVLSVVEAGVDDDDASALVLSEEAEGEVPSTGAVFFVVVVLPSLLSLIRLDRRATTGAVEAVEFVVVSLLSFFAPRLRLPGDFFFFFLFYFG